MSARVAAAAGILLAAACTFEPGQPLARVDARLAAAWTVEPARDAGDGWVRLASDYQVRVDEARLELAAIDLVGTPADLGDFDPASPPPGYSLCHNGHCHAADGRLVAYEEIAAELAGGGAPPVVASLPVGERNLLGGAVAVLACAPDCDLPLGHVGLLRARVVAVVLEGQVRDGRSPSRLPGEVAFTASFALPAGAAITAGVDLPVTRELAPGVRLDVDLVAGPAWLDAVDFAVVPAVDGTLVLGDHAASRDAITDALLESALTGAVSRMELP